MILEKLTEQELLELKEEISQKLFNIPDWSLERRKLIKKLEKIDHIRLERALKGEKQNA